ncbi:MAG TPA: PaaI family thioesterase [Egibacteraceae bacterium]|nr:PaaI family thioesterase [Egibacteraceae bacterium]
MNVWDEPVRGVRASPGLTRLSGIESMRGFLERRFPAPPISRLTGLRPADAGLTHSVFTLPVTRWLLDATGHLMPSTAALVSDAPLGAAFGNSLPAGKVCTTSELSISYLRPAGMDAERLIAQAEVIKAGRTTGLTEARITDAQGRLLAHATSRLVVLDVPVFDDAPLPGPDDAPPTPDPWRREAEGAVADPAAFAGLTGREIFTGWLSGALPRPPVSHLTGIRPQEIGDDAVRWSMPASEWLCSPAPYLYGGATAMLADAALTSAVMPALPADVAFRPLDLKLRFLRPVWPGSGDLTAEGRLVHHGKSIAVTRGEVRAADGKVAILAESSLQLRPTGS